MTTLTRRTCLSSLAIALTSPAVMAQEKTWWARVGGERGRPFSAAMPVKPAYAHPDELVLRGIRILLEEYTCTWASRGYAFQFARLYDVDVSQPMPLLVEVMNRPEMTGSLRSIWPLEAVTGAPVPAIQGTAIHVS